MICRPDSKPKSRDQIVLVFPADWGWFFSFFITDWSRAHQCLSSMFVCGYAVLCELRSIHTSFSVLFVRLQFSWRNCCSCCRKVSVTATSFFKPGWKSKNQNYILSCAPKWSKLDSFSVHGLLPHNLSFGKSTQDELIFVKKKSQREIILNMNIPRWQQNDLSKMILTIAAIIKCFNKASRINPSVYLDRKSVV